MTTGPEHRQIALRQALDELHHRLAKHRRVDDQPVDVDDLDDMPIYTKEPL